LQYPLIREVQQFYDDDINEHKLRKQKLQNQLTKKDNTEDQFSIDETTVPYKGTFAVNLTQYIKSKPHKWGFKLFVRRVHDWHVMEAGFTTSDHMPIEFEIAERPIATKKTTGLTRTEARKGIEAEWQRRWTEGDKGEWTRQLIPHTERWVRRKHGNVDFYLRGVDTYFSYGAFSV
jgi:hypothetical protein